MSHILFLRHAACLSSTLLEDEFMVEDDLNRLTSTGIEQATKMALHLKNVFLEEKPVLYASPVIRAKETAQIIAKELKISIEYFDDLKEREFNFPLNTTVLEFKKLQEESYKNPTKKILDGESVFEHRARLRNWKSRFLDSATKDIIVVSHGGSIEQLFGEVVCNQPDSVNKYFTKLDYGCFHSFKLLKTSVSNSLVWQICSVNTREFTIL